MNNYFILTFINLLVIYINQNWNILLIQISQKQQQRKYMSIIVASVNEKKCNFCFNWIVGASLSKLTLNCCNICLWKYTQKSAEVRTVGGQTYKMLLLKQIQHQAIIRQNLGENIQDQEEQEINECLEKQSGIHMIIEQDGLIRQQQSAPDSSIASISKESDVQKYQILGSVKKIENSNYKSLFLEPDGLKSARANVYQSCFLQISGKQKPLTKSMIHNQFKSLQDSASKLYTSRHSDRYKFYYDHKSIKHFKLNPDTDQRQFGHQLGSNSQREIFSNLKFNLKPLKTSRSGYLNQNQKLLQEQLKYRITSYIEAHYHTPSLHKPMIHYIKQAYEQTNIHHKTLELTSFKVTTMDLLCYLNLFDFQNILTIKLVNVGLTDHQLPILIQFIWNKHIQTLVLSGNKLTEMSLEHFLNKSLPYLKQIYLGKNSINKCKIKENIAQLHSKFTLYL